MANLTGSTTAVFFVRLSTAVDEIVDVDWNTRDGTAIAGKDYEAASGTVSFLPGETEKAIDVVVYGQDDVSADGKKFYIELKPPANAVLSDALAECVITVADEDGVLVTSLVIAQGKRGFKGNPGLSAYEQAVLMGYTGTVEQWMDEIGDASQAAERAESFASQAAERAVIAGQKADKAAEAVISTKQYVDGALASQSAYLDSELANQTQTVNSALSDLSTAANKFYSTLAAANADIANIQVDQPVTIGESANGGLWYKATSGATSLTKSAYDPLTQAKADATTKANAAESNAKTHIDTEIAERIDQINNSQYVAIFEDNNGNIAIGIKPDGSVSIPKLDSDIALNVLDQAAQDATAKANAAKSEAIATSATDATTKANAAEANANSYTDTKIAQVGSGYKTLRIGTDDSIMHFGDSLSVGAYNVQHKAYICQLSQVSPFRHINYSDSGRMLISFQNSLLSDRFVYNATVKKHMPKYTIIATLVNDYAYSNADIKYTQENLRRLVDNLLALGTTPVIFVEFVTTSEQHQAYKAVADEYKIPFISALELNKKIGGYAWVKELFHQPHVGMRTSHLFALPMLDWIEQQLPLRTIKIYRKRTTFIASTDVDLLYKDVIDKSKKWQEIGIGHNYLRNPQYYDEIGETDAANYVHDQSPDDYVRIQNNQNVAFTDYALIEIGLDAFARDVEEIKINLGLSATPQAFVRNNLDPSVALAVGTWNSTDYQSKYALPRGAWRSVDVVGGVITIAKADVIYSMVGNKVQLMLKGAFNLNALRVDYAASKYQTSQPVISSIKRQLGTELLTQHLTDATSLAGWTKVGTVNALVPIDRKPLKNDGTAVAGVCTLTTSNSIAQSVAFTSSEDMRTFKVTVLARYFPKAWVDLTNAVYTVLDSNQTLDRNTQPAPITTSSFDVRELRLETWVGSSIPTATGGAAKHIKPVFMLWNPVEFFVDVAPFTTQLNIRLSAADGEVQVAKVSVKEVL